MKYLRLTITDTMGFWDNDLETYLYDAERGKSFTSWYRFPDAWITGGATTGGALVAERREAVLRYWYGENWRLGNGDGSQYVVLAIDEHELTADEVAQRAWEQAGGSCFAVGDDGGINRIDASQLWCPGAQPGHHPQHAVAVGQRAQVSARSRGTSVP